MLVLTQLKPLCLQSYVLSNMSLHLSCSSGDYSGQTRRGGKALCYSELHRIQIIFSSYLLKILMYRCTISYTTQLIVISSMPLVSINCHSFFLSNSLIQAVSPQILFDCRERMLIVEIKPNTLISHSVENFH